MQIVKLKPNVSLIEVMRRFHRTPNALVMKAIYSRGNGTVSKESEDVPRGPKFIPAHWSILFTGAAPDLAGLIQ